jgi:hypothetical protein
MRVNESLYSFLFGYYLGDGWIIDAKLKNSHQLRLSCDNKYPNIIKECVTAIEACIGKCWIQQRNGCINVCVTCTNEMHLFPQHGSGPKHLREINLEPWQVEFIENEPRQFLRGLFLSDGSICMTYTNPKYKDKTYKTYTFTNKSTDIFKIFIWALSLIGIIKPMPAMYANKIYKITIRDKASVEILDDFINFKS